MNSPCIFSLARLYFFACLPYWEITNVILQLNLFGIVFEVTFCKVLSFNLSIRIWKIITEMSHWATAQGKIVLWWNASFHYWSSSSWKPVVISAFKANFPGCMSHSQATIFDDKCDFESKLCYFLTSMCLCLFHSTAILFWFLWHK